MALTDGDGDPNAAPTTDDAPPHGGRGGRPRRPALAAGGWATGSEARVVPPPCTRRRPLATPRTTAARLPGRRVGSARAAARRAGPPGCARLPIISFVQRVNPETIERVRRHRPLSGRAPISPRPARAPGPPARGPPTAPPTMPPTSPGHHARCVSGAGRTRPAVRTVPSLQTRRGGGRGVVASGRLAIGVDIGGTKVAGGIVDESGAIVERTGREGRTA